MPASSLKGPKTRWALLAVLLGLALTASGRVGNHDLQVTLECTRSLLHGSVELPADCTTCPPGVEGVRTSPYGIGHSLYLIPYVLCGRLFARVLPGLGDGAWEEFFVSFSNIPVVLTLLVYLSRCWNRLGGDDVRIAFGIIGFATCTLLGPYAKLPFSDAILGLGVFAAWSHWTERASYSGLWAGLWLGIALVSRRQADIVVPTLLALIAADALSSDRVCDLSRVFLGLVPAVMLRLAYNQARFGSPWLEIHPGLSVDHYVQRSIHNPWHFKWEETLLSPEHGFLLYLVIPIGIALLGSVHLWRRSRWDAIAAVWMPITGVVALSKLGFGPGVSFGARYLLYTIPFLGLSWPLLPAPRNPVLRLGTLMLFVASSALMMTGIALDPLPIRIRMGDEVGLPQYLNSCRAEWVRVLWQDAPPTLRLSTNPAWNHDPFTRPDFWWLHAIARVSGIRPHGVQPGSDTRGSPFSVPP